MKKIAIIILSLMCIGLKINAQENEYYKKDFYIGNENKEYSRNDFNNTNLIIKNYYINDRYAIKLTDEEFEQISNMDINDVVITTLMNEKGIYFNSGLIPIKVGNKKMIMVTFKYDFGTILTLETIEEFFGKDIRNHYARY